MPEGRRQGEKRSDRWMEPRRMNTRQQVMFYSWMASKLNVAFFVREKGGIMRCNKENPRALKVNCACTPATAPAEFRHSFQ